MTHDSTGLLSLIKGKLYDCSSLPLRGCFPSAVQGQRKLSKAKKSHWVLETLTGLLGGQTIGAKGKSRKTELGRSMEVSPGIFGRVLICSCMTIKSSKGGERTIGSK